MPARRRFGSVRRLPSGTWQARYIDHAGRRHTAPQTFASRRDADRWLSLVEADLERGTWHDPRAGRMTFAAWCKEYLAGAVHLRPTTANNKAAVVNRWLLPALGPIPLAAITQRHVRRLVEDMSRHLAPSSVRSRYAVLHSILAAAVDAELLVVTPCRRIQLPRDSAVAPPRLSVEEMARLVAAMRPAYAPMVWLAGLLTLRWQEAAGLTVGSIDFLGRPPKLEITHTVIDLRGRAELVATAKTDSSLRPLLVPPTLVEILARHIASSGRRERDDLLFQAVQGGPLRYSWFRARVWVPATQAAGLDGLTFHGLRHSAAGLLRTTGAHTQVIARWMGHGDDRVTSKVYGWVPDQLDVAARDGLEGLLAEVFGHAQGTERPMEGGAGGPAGR